MWLQACDIRPDPYLGSRPDSVEMGEENYKREWRVKCSNINKPGALEKGKALSNVWGRNGS